jgi:hypothetical protein
MSSAEKAVYQPHNVTHDEPTAVPSLRTLDGGLLTTPNDINNFITVDWNGPDDPENPRK